jgi:hypothetical protein
MKNKRLWVLLGVVVVVLMVFWIIQSRHHNSTSSQNTSANSQTNTPTPQPTPPPSNNAAYNQALVTYTSRRIQFQQSCQAVPNVVVYKTGTTIMLDNRASISHTIKMDGVSYLIGAYNFRLVTLSNSKLPHMTLIDCDKSQNVATITIEK